MASLVTRTVTTFVITGQKLYWDAEKNSAEISHPVTVTLQNIRRPNEEKAKAILVNHYGNAEYINVTVEESSVTYGVELDIFMEIAHEVERAPSQRKKKKNENQEKIEEKEGNE